MEIDVDRTDIVDALFGKEQWHYQFDQSGDIVNSSSSRKRDGAWIRNSGFRNTRVSGVLAFHHASPSSLASTSICLYKNPGAAKSVPEELNCLPHAMVVGEQMEWVEGRSLGSILGLPEG